MEEGEKAREKEKGEKRGDVMYYQRAKNMEQPLEQGFLRIQEVEVQLVDCRLQFSSLPRSVATKNKKKIEQQQKSGVSESLLSEGMKKKEKFERPRRVLTALL